MKSAARLAITLALVASWAAGCASAPSRPGAPEAMGPSEPAAPGEETAPEQAGPPAPRAARQVTLVVGPGMAKSLAAVGVLQVLDARGIHVTRIVGMEMGALIAALYGAGGRTGPLEWTLMKLKLSETFSERSWVGKILNLSSKRAEFRRNFERVYPRLTFENLKVPAMVLLTDESGTDLTKSGPVLDVVESAIFDAPAGQTTLPVAAIAALVGGPRIWVGIPSPNEPVPEGDVWVEPDLRGIDVMAFGARNEIVFRGKKAANASIPASGLPAEESPGESR